MKYLYIIASLMLLSGAALGLYGHIVFDALYLLGAVLYLVYHLLGMRTQGTLRQRRAWNMQIFASLCFVVSAIFRLGFFASYVQGGWVLSLTIGVVFMLYANVVVPLTSKEK